MFALWYIFECVSANDLVAWSSACCDSVCGLFVCRARLSCTLNWCCGILSGGGVEISLLWSVVEFGLDLVGMISHANCVELEWYFGLVVDLLFGVF